VKKMTFSQAVKELIHDGIFRIEVTGVKGKTSSCYVLAHILSRAGKKVFLHTSRGQGPWSDGEHVIERKMSIAPTSLLKLPEKGYDCIIAEVSLGGSGKADIAVITNLAEDYGIANNTKRASYAKADILTDKINVVHENETEIWKKYGERGFRTYGNNIRTESVPKLGGPLDISFEYNGHRCTTLNREYLSLQYIRPMDLATEICKIMDIPADDVVAGLRTFTGVPGRGEISFRSGRWYVTDRNPGVSALSIRMTLNCLKEMNSLENAIVIVDPVSRKVCDRLCTEDVRETAEEFGVEVHFKEICDTFKLPATADVIAEFVKEEFR